VPGPDEREVVRDHEPGEEVEVRGRRSVVDRLGRLTVDSEPLGGGPMDLRRGPGVRGGELERRELGEQRVDAVPPALPQPGDEEVGALQRPEHRGRIRAPEHRVAERRGEAAEDRDAQEEAADVVVERTQHLLAQEIGDEAVVPGELADDLRHVVHAAKPDRGELDRGRPSLGPAVEQLELRRLEVDVASAGEQLGRLGRGEREVLGTQLDQRSPHPVSGDPEGGVAAGDQHEARVRGKALGRVVDRCQAVGGGDRLELVEDDDHLFPERANAFDELFDGVVDRRPGGPEAVQRAAPEPLANAVDRRCDVRPQPDGIVVSDVERHPGERHVPALAPGPDDRRLPEARRRGDERQGGAVARVERVQETRPPDQLRAEKGSGELRLGERRRPPGASGSTRIGHRHR
jgi:hypothetical protein